MKIKRVFVYSCIAIFLFSTYKVVDSYVSSYQNQQVYASVQEVYNNDVIPKKSIPPKESNEPIIQEPFESLLDINEDTVGWISIEDTKIDYPIVQRDDNEYYLTHDFEQTPSKAGSIFMDFRNASDFTDRHSILYGHHMRDGSMFKGLMAFRDIEFFEENQVFSVQSLYEETRWEIFSAYVTDTTFYYIVTDFDTDEEYLDFLHELQVRSLHKTDIELSSDDQILTLSTCAYDFNDARFVVHARKIQ
ncbi:class B sortase [Bacillus alkalicellulosilyticus]|uniref:class B sortase n=1 Tax=Alkalihalobacterium alkalicellulosilyticum TaxID=1912214 RepID=UPI001482906F|nr:class B sortase [Bacillus alkalicellulosilyticus]